MGAVVDLPALFRQAERSRRMHHGLRPEGVELGQSVFGGVPGQDGARDGTDGRADDPIGLNAGLVQVLVSARQIGAERIATSQHERYPWCARHADLLRAFSKKRPPFWGGPSLGRKRPRRAATPNGMSDVAVHKYYCAAQSSRAFRAWLRR